MTLRNLRTVITKNDMARIFEYRASNMAITRISKEIGYSADTIKRGVVVAELFGMDACR